MKFSLKDVETPAVIIDRELLQQNIARGAAHARNANIRLRPHVKSHKSVAIAKMQIESGAHGITVAKSSEALPFIKAGISDITIAHPLVDRRKIARLLEVAGQHQTALTLIGDSQIGIDAIVEEASAKGVSVNIQMKIDVGLHRCGVDPSGNTALELARLITDRTELRFAGILSHAGHAYAAATADDVRHIAATERRLMLDVADRIQRAGISVPSISIGSTPTVWHNDGFDGISEIRPGNYVFMDLTQTSLEVVPQADIALSVLATVISCNPTYAIIDAGSKVLSSDRGPHGSTRLSGYGRAFPAVDLEGPGMTVTSLSEEHGFVNHGGRQLAVGTQLRILPNHACPVVNLARELFIIDPDGTRCVLPVDAGHAVL